MQYHVYEIHADQLQNTTLIFNLIRSLYAVSAVLIPKIAIPTSADAMHS